jgi:hypothetical protein
MKKLIPIILLIFLSSCKKQQEKNCFTSFTYSKGNIKMYYLLSFNSSDTVYYLDKYPWGVKKKLQYFLLDESQKKYLNKITCKLKFPINDSVLLNNNIEDGTTIAFSIDNKRLMLHGHKGPKEFWVFEEWIENMKNYHGLKPINRKIKFDSFDKMLPSPPIFTKVISKKQIIGTWKTVGKELLTVDISTNQIAYREHKESHNYKINADSIYIYYHDFILSGEPYLINDDTLVISTSNGKVKYVRKK